MEAEIENIEIMNENLKAENEALKTHIRTLEANILLLQTHPVFVSGLKGEALICKALDGQMTSFAEKFDVLVGETFKLEVKYSKLNTPNKKYPLKRWNWSKPLGSLDRGKAYDLLVLIGEKDERFTDQYCDNTPYVYFVVPKKDVHDVMTMGRLAGGNVQINTDLSKANSIAQIKLKSFLISFKEIENLTEFYVGSGKSQPEVNVVTRLVEGQSQVRVSVGCVS